MAKYRFKCSSCLEESYLFASSSSKTEKCRFCGGVSNRLIPMTLKPNITELIDSYTGVNLSPDHRQEIDQRSLDYFWSVEVKRLCSELSPEESIRQGFAYLDEQGRFMVYDKPPNRR
jgi:hypothetical protein